MIPRRKSKLNYLLTGMFRQDLKAQAGGIARAYLLSLVAIATALMIPWPLKIIIDSILGGDPLPAFLNQPEWNFSAEWWVVLISSSFLLLTAIEAISDTSQKMIIARVREQLNLSIRDRLLAHIQSLSALTKQKYRNGELVLRLVSDVNIFTRLMTKTIPALFQYSLSALLTLGIMFYLDTRLGLLGLLTFTGLTIAAKRYDKALKKATRRKRRVEGRVAGLAQEIMRCLPFIQALGREVQTRKQFYDTNASSLSAGVEAEAHGVNMQRTLKLTNGLAVALVTGAGAWMVLEKVLSIGELTVFVAYMKQLMKPVDKVNDLAQSMARGLAGAEQISYIFEEQPAIVHDEGALRIGRSEGRIEIEAVRFAYSEPGKESRFVLNGVNLTLAPDSLTLLRGASGSGKSTLLALLLRLFEPDSGRISLDGIPLQSISPASLRDNISVMLQEAYLFSGTIREALSMNDDSIPEAALWEALAFVDLKQFVRNLPAGLDSPLAEAGLNLSGGQKKRLSLARAFLLDRAVLLLDEPLANIDQESARVILAALNRIRSGKTCLVISHNPVLIDFADRVYYLENGNIFENQPLAEIG